MAKAKLPLLSLEARGQLGKSIVYFPWKGINAVRSYVIPANPQAPGQVDRRAILEQAVDEWHLAKYDTDDRLAWNRYSGILPDPMSGFNAFVRSWCLIKDIPADACIPGFNGSLVDGALNKFTVSIEEAGTADAADFIWGYTPTSLIQTQALAEAPANTWTSVDVVAASGARVYGRFRIKTGGVLKGESGLFYLKLA